MEGEKGGLLREIESVGGRVRGRWRGTDRGKEGEREREDGRECEGGKEEDL